MYPYRTFHGAQTRARVPCPHVAALYRHRGLVKSQFVFRSKTRLPVGRRTNAKRLREDYADRESVTTRFVFCTSCFYFFIYIYKYILFVYFRTTTVN